MTERKEIGMLLNNFYFGGLRLFSGFRTFFGWGCFLEHVEITVLLVRSHFGRLLIVGIEYKGFEGPRRLQYSTPYKLVWNFFLRPLMEAAWPENHHPTYIPLFQRRRFSFSIDINFGWLRKSITPPYLHKYWGCPRGVMVKAMNCGIVVREFVLQSHYYVHFRANTLGKGMNPLILPPAMGK